MTSFEERITIIGLILSLASALTYAAILTIRAVTDGLALTEAAWQGPLMLTIGMGGGLYGLVYLIGIIRSRGQRLTDERDTQIRARSEVAASGLTGIGVLAALIMLALNADAFWVAHTLFLLTWLGSIAGASAALAAYRTGL